MNKENISVSKVERTTGRVTRAQAKSLSLQGRQVLKPPRPDQNRVLRANSKRVASDDSKPASASAAGLLRKRRATLTDVTNVLRQKTYAACFAGEKLQENKQVKKALNRKTAKVVPTIPVVKQDNQDVKDKIAEDIYKLTVQPQVALLSKENDADDASVFTQKCTKLENILPVRSVSHTTKENSNVFPLVGPIKTEDKHHENTRVSDCPNVIDIDKQKDPLLCSLYAPEIFENKRVTELNQRPATDYMEKVQSDTSPSMRGILVDWLVEVSEEYKLVPDTLYLTVNLIDRYLSGNYIEKQRLQLLGVTCMLIASKYEEMTAPQVEEFCYITANTYTKEEVIRMERMVLNFLCFQLSVPTAKTFLRRYVHAAQATYKVPMVDLELLANYLAELTLVEYNFLKFLPSLVAASAVFLARWTLDQSVHPWNPTLEHYTCYKTTDLKDAVIALQNLQLNTSGCPLNAIREKYRHQKFNNVASLLPSKTVQSLF